MASITPASCPASNSPSWRPMTFPRGSTNISVGQARTAYSRQTRKSRSLTTGCRMPCRRTAWRTASVACSAVNLAEWTPITTRRSAKRTSSSRNCGST